MQDSVHSADTWEINRRGALGKSTCDVMAGTGTVYVGLDQPAAEARDLADLKARIASGTDSNPIVAAETFPYSEWLKKRSKEEEISPGDPKIVLMIESEPGEPAGAYLESEIDDLGSYDPFVRIRPAVTAVAA